MSCHTYLDNADSPAQPITNPLLDILHPVVKEYRDKRSKAKWFIKHLFSTVSVVTPSGSFAQVSPYPHLERLQADLAIPPTAFKTGTFEEQWEIGDGIIKAAERDRIGEALEELSTEIEFPVTDCEEGYSPLSKADTQLLFWL